MSRIYRSKKDKDHPYVVLDKTGLNDPRLSWKAKGLLSYILSKPDNWKIFVSELCKHAKDGKDSTGSGINELIQFGYITRKRSHKTDGKFNGYDYEVHEKPQTPVKPTVTGKTVNGLPVNGKPATTIYSIELNNKGSLGTDIFSKIPGLKKQIGKKQYEALNEVGSDEDQLHHLRSFFTCNKWGLLIEWLEHRLDIKKTATPKAIKKLIKTFNEFTVEELTEAVDKGIESGHTGLFPKKKVEFKRRSFKGDQKPSFTLDPKLFTQLKIKK